MNTLSVRLRYRPVRIGWCVTAGDLTAFRTAVRLSFTMWGGRYNPIIPVDEPDLAHALVRLYRVDVLQKTSEGNQTAAFTDGYKHLPWPFFHEELFTPNMWDGKDALIADISHPIKRISRKIHRWSASPEPGLDVYEWKESDPLADVFACTFGAFPPVAETGIDYLGMANAGLIGTLKTIEINGEVPPLHPARETIASLNRAFVERHYTVQNYWNHPGFYIGEIDNLQDLINFWNLRAAGISLLFHDPRYSDRLAHLREQWAEQIRQMGPQPHGPEGVAIWHREDRPLGNDHEVFGEGLSVVRIDNSLWNGLNIRVPIMHFGEDSVLASVGEISGKPSISFAVPATPFAESQDNYNQHCVLSVDTTIGLFGNDRATLHAPFIPQLNEFYGRNSYYEWNAARAEPESLGLITSISKGDTTLNALNVSQLIKEIFSSVGISASPSKPGLIATTIMQQMGGLDSCRPFKIAGVRNLIENHRPDQSFNRATAAQTILGVGTDRSLSDYQSLFIEYREPGQALTKDAVLSYLLNRGVFRAGLKFDCPNCQLEFWVSLDDAKSRLECEYCGHVFNASAQLRDKAWAFRRSGLFGRDDHQEGAIPVLLTLQQLVRTGRPGSAIFTTAMDLNLQHAAITACETDFVVVHSVVRDQKIDIVIGECKTRKAITADDVTKLKAIADAFPSDHYNVFVVFARLTPFTPEEVELIKQVNGPYQQRAIILTARELEPYFVYELTEKEFDIDKIAVTYSDMAKVTDRVFFKKLRRSSESG